jgi:bifunctional DNase/RNase
MMIRVNVDSIRISLKGPERAVLLKEIEEDRQLPIFIHATEAEAIATELEGYRPPRPLTHDLLKNCIAALGGELQYILINDLRDNIFFAVLHVLQDSREIDVDARPSDSIALAVRARVPIFVTESVMEAAGVYPAEDIQEDQEHLAVFRDFVETLGLDDLEE